MYIFNASDEVRTFPYSNGTLFSLMPRSASETKGGEPKLFSGLDTNLVKMVQSRAKEKGSYDMGIILPFDTMKEELQAVMDTVDDPSFVFKSVEEAEKVLLEGKPKVADLSDGVRTGYEIKFAELNKEIEGKTNEITRLKGDIEAFKLNESASNDKILKLETELAQEKTRGEGTEEKLNALRKNYTEKELELKAERDTNQALRQRITSLESELKMTNDTLTASKTNYAKAQEAYDKLNKEFSNVIVNYGMSKQADGLWRIPKPVDEVKNTNALQDVVNRYDMKLFEDRYYLPGDVPTIEKPKMGKK